MGAWNWKGFKGAAKQLASVGLPLLGTVLGGPLGGAAGAAVASLLGVDESEITPENMLAWSKDPDKLIKLKEIESNHEYRMAALALQTVEMGFKDVSDARQMHIETTKATGSRDVNLYVLAWVIVLGIFSLVGVIIFQPLPEDSNGVIFMLFGALTAGFNSVLQFFFGSSKGSMDKTKIMAAAANENRDKL